MTYFAILTWPFFALRLFARLPLVQAFVWAVLLPYLLLPQRFEIDLPALPPLSKTTVISLGLILAFFIYARRSRPQTETDTIQTSNTLLRRLIILCVVMVFVGGLATIYTNRDPIFFTAYTLPAARPWDAISGTADTFLRLVPFFIGAMFLASPRHHQTLLVTLVIAGLAYSALILVELRLSPQLHRWVYGYHQHQFAQHIRDGFRPMVFLDHGLSVGFFVFTTLMAAMGLWRTTADRKWLWAAGYLFLILAISRNLGALMIACLLIPVFFFFSKKAQTSFIAATASLILLFPAVREFTSTPVNTLLSVAERINADRAASLQFRLEHEDKLLDKAIERPLFGWAGWGRSRVYNEEGRDLSVTDGYWVIQLGQYGWVGYLANYGFLVLPLIFLSAARRRKDISFNTLSMGLIGIGNLIYLIPNSTLTPVGLLIFGAVAGYAIYDTVSDTAEPDTATSQTRPVSQYTRGAQIHGRRAAPRSGPRFSRASFNRAGQTEKT